MLASKKRCLSSLVFAAIIGSVVVAPTVSHAAEYQLDDIVVDGTREKSKLSVVESTTYGGGQVARVNSVGALGERANIDTPFNISGYTSQLIEDKQFKTVDDVVAMDASVTNASAFGAQTTWNIRGINVEAEDTSFNGLYGAGPTSAQNLDNIERVEVLKGPAAMLNGMSPNGSLGGNINLVPKRAENMPTRRLTVGIDNGHQWRQHIDVGQRFGKNNKYGIRFNASHTSGSGKADGEHRNDNNIAVGVDVRGDRYRASLDAGVLNTTRKNYSMPVRLAGINFVPAATDFPHDFSVNGTYNHVKEQYLAAKAEYDFNKDWTVYAGFGFKNAKRDSVASLVNITSANLGGYINPAPAATNYHANSQTLGIRGKVKTGSIKHDINLVGTRYDSTAGAARSADTTAVRVNFTDLYDASWRNYTGYSLRGMGLPRRSHTALTGVALTDVISTKDDKWQFITGIRYQNIKSENYNTTTGVETSSYNKSAWSPGFGIVHKFTPKFAVYGNYIQGLQQGEIVGNYPNYYVNANEVFEPYKAKQKEIGFKYDGRKYGIQASYYMVDLPAYDDMPTNITRPSGKGTLYRYEQVGTTKNRGFEFSYMGEPTEGTRIIASYMYLQAKLDSSTSPTINGKQNVGRPRHTAVLSIDQDIKAVKGLAVSATATYHGSSYLNTINTLRVSPWVRWDMGVRYKFNVHNTPITLRADVYNVFNHKYWDATGYRMFYAKDRTLAVSLTADF